MFTNPRILIFDEATSALDDESEAIIRENLIAIADGRTMVIIAHKGTVMEKAKRIVRIADGELHAGLSNK